MQDQLDGKKKPVPKVSSPLNPDLYLRIFLYCPVCGYRLTGTVSKRHGGLYPYYCSNHDHSHLNMRAEKVNDGFLEHVGMLHPNKAILALYNEVLMEIRVDERHQERRRMDPGIGLPQSEQAVSYLNPWPPSAMLEGGARWLQVICGANDAVDSGRDGVERSGTEGLWYEIACSDF